MTIETKDNIKPYIKESKELLKIEVLKNKTYHIFNGYKYEYNKGDIFWLFEKDLNDDLQNAILDDRIRIIYP